MLSTEKLRHWVTRRRWQRRSKAIRAMKKMSDLMIRRRSLRATASEDWGGSWTGLSGSSSSLPGDLGASGSSTSLNSQESPPPCQMRSTPPSVAEKGMVKRRISMFEKPTTHEKFSKDFQKPKD